MHILNKVNIFRIVHVTALPEWKSKLETSFGIKYAQQAFIYLFVCLLNIFLVKTAGSHMKL